MALAFPSPAIRLPKVYWRMTGHRIRVREDHGNGEEKAYSNLFRCVYHKC
jgi:hypothetical protein